MAYTFSFYSSIKLFSKRETKPPGYKEQANIQLTMQTIGRRDLLSRGCYRENNMICRVFKIVNKTQRLTSCEIATYLWCFFTISCPPYALFRRGALFTDRIGAIAP